LSRRQTRTKNTTAAAFLLTLVVGGGPLVAPTLFARPAFAQAENRRYEPAKTPVVVLPVIDATGEKLAERRKRQEDVGYKNLIEQFTQQGFPVVDAAKVNQALADAKIDLHDEENYRRDTFYKIARAAGGDLVVFVLIQDTRTDIKKSLWKGDEVQGRAKIKMWLLDAKAESPIVSAVVKEGKAAGASKLFAMNEGTDRRANAAGNAVKEQLGEFFKTGLAAAPATASASSAVVSAPPPADTPAPDAAAPLVAAAKSARSVFVLADGSALVGSLVRFDGAVYTVSTDDGMRSLKAAGVK
jgi:hypothetical protein